MQPRTLDSILSELAPTYDPQIQSLRTRQNLVPQSVDADIQEAQGAKTQAFDDILGGARRRGLGFSGIPLGEQAKYASNVFAPNVLRARTAGQERALSLEDAILGVQERRNTQAQGIRQNETTMAEQQRQFNEQMAFNRQQAAAQQRAQAAAASNTFNPSLGAGNMTTNGTPFPKGMSARTDPLGKLTGYNFVNPKGQPISAASYAAQNQIPLGDLLHQMGSSGDKTAQTAYNWIKSIQGTDMFNSGKYKETPAFRQLSSIFWGA